MVMILHCTLQTRHRPARDVPCVTIQVERRADGSVYREVTLTENYCRGVWTSRWELSLEFGFSFSRSVRSFEGRLDLIFVSEKLEFCQMGNGASKEEQLYQAVANSNHNAVKALRRDGASLEFVDKEGRTPLILACTRGDLFEMVLTLLNLGANIKAYRPGSYGGYPLHHAAKRGLEKTVLLLLSRGADPLAVNDDSLTPLEMARNRGHVAVVRMIEDRISVFSGMLRELSGPGFLEALAPQWLTKKVWAVILPTETDPRRTPRFELVIYQAPKVSLWNGGFTSPSGHAAGFSNVPVPRTIISLSKAEVEEPNFSSADPVVVILDRNTKTKYKFLTEEEGDKAQLERFYNSCKGVPQIAPVPSGYPLVPQAVLQGLSALTRPAAQPHTHAFDQEPPGGNSPATGYDPPHQNPKNRVELSEEAALKMAIDASLRSASAEGVPVDPDDLIDGRWVGETGHSQYSGWRSANEAGPSRVSELSEDRSKAPEVLSEDSASSTSVVPPSAPPLPIQYPPIDISPANLEFAAVTPPEEASASASKAEEKGSQCVVCWDAPAEGVCIPCGHLAGCMECLSEIKGKNWGCPVCRAPIEQVIRVYAV